VERTVVACLGDSITAGSPLWDPDPDVRTRIGAALDERSRWEWWAERRDATLDLRNHGVYGERADQNHHKQHTTRSLTHGTLQLRTQH